jgi:acetolactate synthase-1/2/3 large subunit
MLWLQAEGYTDCFFVGGGNSMYLLEAASKTMKCRAFVHEVSAVIAAEYFNEVSGGSRKAFALLTAGPGLTNAVTGIAGAWLENRGVLIIGGQVKVSDLKGPGMRQRGIQEIDGVRLVSSITKTALRLDRPYKRSEIIKAVRVVFAGRPGPVFLEVCIDVSVRPSNGVLDDFSAKPLVNRPPKVSKTPKISKASKLVKNSKRPLLLLGNGVNRSFVRENLVRFEKLGLPIASTWTGADRAPSTYKFFAGRPNLFGMRWANLVQQQADLVIAVGTRLNLQQTGFNWQSFAPLAKVIHVDIDGAELKKGHPQTFLKINEDASEFLTILLDSLEQDGRNFAENWGEWNSYVREVRQLLPEIETSEKNPDFINPHKLIRDVSLACSTSDILVSCSSGGTFTAALQSAQIKDGQTFLSNKGLASMGYGLAGSIGASLANPQQRVVLFEGDGGFAQNLQELGTVAVNNLNLKIFVFDNDGYASIRSTQKRLLGGNYLGCDSASGLGLPDWVGVIESFGISVLELNAQNPLNEEFESLFSDAKPVCFIVRCNPEYEYLPKVMSKKDEQGVITSDPIHEMWPPLSETMARRVLKYLN